MVIEAGGGEKEPVLEGYIDVLVVRSQVWVVLIESKRNGFSVRQALPQILAYMMANRNFQNPIFGMINEWRRLDNPQSNELYEVVQIMNLLVNLSVSV